MHSESSTLLLPKSGQKQALKGLSRMLSRALPQRVILAGGPRAGKTTLAQSLASPRVRLRGSDELAGLGWSESSLAASLWFDEPGPWICEGVAMPRALRKWLKRNTGTPADLIVWMPAPVVARSRGQHIMALGCETVWNEIRPALKQRGTSLLELNAYG